LTPTRFNRAGGECNGPGFPAGMPGLDLRLASPLVIITMCNGQDLTGQPLHQGIISSDKIRILEIPPQKVNFAIQGRRAGKRSASRLLHLISCNRVEKSASPEGSEQMQCKWSGKMTMASMVNGRRRRAALNTGRKSSRCSVKSFPGRANRVTVKKNVPPETKARMY